MNTKAEYKIRRKSDDKFSTGGGPHKYNAWSKTGKTWTNSGALKNHLIQHLEQGDYAGVGWDKVEVVEIQLVIVEGTTKLAKELIDQLRESKIKKLSRCSGEWYKSQIKKLKGLIRGSGYGAE